MKTKLLLFAVTGLAIAASAPTFAAGTSSPFDAQSAAPLTAAYVETNLYAEAVVKVEPKLVAIANIKYIVDAKANFKTIADAKGLGDPNWKTITMTRGVPDDDLATLKTALVNSSAQGGGESGSYSATTTLAASSGTSTAAPAIGYTITDLARLTKPERTAVAIITV